LKPLLYIFCLLASAVQAQDLGANSLNSQTETRRSEAKPIVKAYLPLFQDGTTADGLAVLGEEYFKISKPIQAVEIFIRALALQADHAGAMNGKAKATKNLESKNARIAKLQVMEEKAGNAQHACSRAAILFHLGYMGDALDVLKDANNRYRNNGEILALEHTLKGGIAIETMVVRAVLKDFRQNLTEKKLTAALNNLAEYHVFSLGTGNTRKLLKELTDTFPTELDSAKVKAALGV